MSIDIFPTLLTAIGSPLPSGLPGLNLFDDAAVKNRKELFGACFTHNAVDLNDPTKNVENRWMISGDWKLIAPAAASPQTGTSHTGKELFNLKTDPTELHNLAAPIPNMCYLHDRAPVPIN